ncbi:cysteine proteinase inhibitor 1-like [Rutidosis leptorrhynchoides]|uniref:cysteine proteinase inhibitor 1-like n=1 Tax=Rutidosis leptorrhynchoides TaxID=125765 RepID=UPI003A99B8FC
MAKVNINFFMLLVAFMLYNSCMISGESTLGDDWQPIDDLDDPWLIRITKFAVDVHNQNDHASLIWKGVVAGWNKKDEVFGTYYKTTIAATDGAAQNNYEAIVWDVPRQRLVLKSFTGPF